MINNLSSLRNATLTLALLTTPATAATAVLTLDDFDTGTYSLAFPNGGNDTGTLTHDHAPGGNSVLGGRRLSSWQVVANPGSRNASASVVSSPPLSVLFVSSGPAVDATMSLRYGTPVTGSLTDLEQGAADSFQFSFASLTQSLNLLVTVSDSAGATYSSSVTASATGDHLLPFASFPGFTPGSFSNVRVVDVTFDSPTLAPDYLVDGFFTSQLDPVPEPSTSLFGALGLATFLLRRKR